MEDESRPSSPYELHFWSKSATSASTSRSDSSVAWSTGSGDSILAPAVDERTKSTAVCIEDKMSPLDEPKLRCLHPGCFGCSFTRKSDWTRHMKIHDPGAISYQCGCCHNLGRKFNPSKRPDKVREHLQKQHDALKPKGQTPGILCPVDGCHMLLTATTCLDEHLEREHPDYTMGTGSHTNNGSTCDCKSLVDSMRFQRDHRSHVSKQRLRSPLESAAKRGKHHTGTSQGLDLVPQSAECSPRLFPSLALTTSHLAGWTSPLPTDYPNFYGSNVNATQNMSWQDGAFGSTMGFIDEGLPFAIERGTSLDANNFSLDVACPALFSQKTSDQPVYITSRPAAFFAVRETQGFRDMAVILRAADINDPLAPTTSMTYNPKRGIVTLEGSSPTIEQAKLKLKGLLEDFSKKWNNDYLMKSHSGVQHDLTPSRRHATDSETAHGTDNPARVKSFPIVPKNNKPLVRHWFKCLLPALPGILSCRLGGNYTASLVLRGQYKLHSLPYVQIESRFIPGKEAQELIQSEINVLCDQSHPQVLVRFVQGSLKQLKGGEEGNANGPGETADSQRRKFNHVRPCSKPAMGASIGLLCSKKVSATLGGYITLDGEKYILTSDHFIDTSEDHANKDLDEASQIVTSPSRHDLNHLEDCLRQSALDLASEIESLTQKTYGDWDIPGDCLSDQSFLTDELNQKVARDKDITSLLGQVNKPPLEYAVGTVFIRKVESRSAPIPDSLADIVDWETCKRGVLEYHMDWSLCKLKRQNVENRHKFRSPQDAMEDDYVEEEDRSTQPGDVCHTTCEAEAGVAVHYVGQRSLSRSGLVNIPMLVSRNSRETHEWAIIDSEGQEIEYADVAGDSGAWVIRRNRNELMGQVHSIANGGQVLFTPINVIFDDINKNSGFEASLPPCTPGPEHHATEVRPLCAVQDTSPASSYKFLCDTAGKSAIISHTDSAYRSVCSSPSRGSPSPLPLRKDASQPPKPPEESSQSSAPPINAAFIGVQPGDRGHNPKTPRTVVSAPTECESAQLSFNKPGDLKIVKYLAPHKPRLSARFVVRFTPSTARSSAWPARNRSGINKVRTLTGPSQLRRKSWSHRVPAPTKLVGQTIGAPGCSWTM